jgi:hypothetical protein
VVMLSCLVPAFMIGYDFLIVVVLVLIYTFTKLFDWDRVGLILNGTALIYFG